MLSEISVTIFFLCIESEVNCKDKDTSETMMGKGKILEKGRTHCVAGAPNNVGYKNNTPIPGISIH